MKAASRHGLWTRVSREWDRIRWLKANSGLNSVGTGLNKEHVIYPNILAAENKSSPKKKLNCGFVAYERKYVCSRLFLAWAKEQYYISMSLYVYYWEIPRRKSWCRCTRWAKMMSPHLLRLVDSLNHVCRNRDGFIGLGFISCPVGSSATEEVISIVLIRRDISLRIALLLIKIENPAHVAS